MPDSNADNSHLCRSSNADCHRSAMSRVAHQTSNRPMHLSNLDDSSFQTRKETIRPTRSKAQKRMKTEIDFFWEFIDEILLRGKNQHPKQSVSKQNSKLQSRTTPHETFRSSSNPYSSSHHRAGPRASHELYGTKTERGVPEENTPHYGLLGEIKQLFKFSFLGHAEDESQAVHEKQREERAAVRSRAEKATSPTSFDEHGSLRFFQESNYASIARPQPAVTRTKYEAIPQNYSTIQRKPVPERTGPEREVSGYTGDPKQVVVVERDPSRFNSMRAVRQMVFNASTASSKRNELTYGSRSSRSRVTQLGDFMKEGPGEAMRSMPPKELNRQIIPSSPKATPCSVCGTFPREPSHFSWTPTNLWLCPACTDPIVSPIEAPPSPSKRQKSQRQHAPPYPKGSSIPDSTIFKARSPLSEVIQRGRNMSNASNPELLPNDDGNVSPLREWERDMVDMDASMPPSRPHTLLSKESGKHPNLYQIPPIRPLSPLQPKPRATSSVYPEDESPMAVPDVPVPAIPARFLQEKAAKSLKAKQRKVTSNIYPADDEEDPRLDMPLPPIPLKGRGERPKSLRLQEKGYRKPKVEEVVEEEDGGRLGVKRFDNRRSSFYRPEKEIFAEY